MSLMIKNISLGNLIASVITGIGWFLAVVLSTIAESMNSDLTLGMAGILLIFLSLLNFMGLVFGIVSTISNVKDWKSWASLGLHGSQLLFFLFLIVVGMVAKS